MNIQLYIQETRLRLIYNKINTCFNEDPKIAIKRLVFEYHLFKDKKNIASYDYLVK